MRIRNLFKEVDRLIEFTRFGNISIEDTLKKISRPGEKIRQLYYQVEVDAKEATAFVPVFNRQGELSQIISLLVSEKLYVGPAGDRLERIGRIERMVGFFKKKIHQR